VPQAPLFSGFWLKHTGGIQEMPGVDEPDVYKSRISVLLSLLDTVLRSMRINHLPPTILSIRAMV
jgi:hypothetical protein